MVKWVRLVVACGLCVALTGCPDAGVPVDGKVVKAAAPYTLGDNEKIAVTLQSDDGKTSAGADVQPDGTFKIKTSTGTGVPNGKYKVSFTHYGAPGAKAGGSPATRSIPEVWDVTPTTKSFTLDIATVTGKK